MAQLNSTVVHGALSVTDNISEGGVSLSSKYLGINGQVNADWNAASGKAQILNKPTIPTVNNSTITIKQTGINDQTFTLNGAAATITLVDNNTTYAVFSGASASASGTTGLVPVPAAGAQAKFLRGDATWQSTPYPSNFGGATTTKAGSAGLVPAPGTGDTAKFLRGDGGWQSTPYPSVFVAATTTKAGSAGLVPAPTTSDTARFLGNGGWTTLPIFVGATSTKGSPEGLVPGVNTGTTASFLRSDGNWTGTPYPSVFVAATTTKAGSSGLVPTPSINDTAKYLANGGWAALPTLSGATTTKAGSAGLVPAPGTGDTAKFLRGDGGWAAAITSLATGTSGTGNVVSSITVSGNKITYNKDVTALTSVADASTSTRGLVNTTTQTFGGVKTFNDGCYGALWNDLADCIPIQSGLNPEAGYCYSFDGENYEKSTKYLDKQFIGIHSDTYGFAMGKEENKVKLDVAVAGFVLAYTDKKYKTGTPLTCGKNGVLTKIRFFDRIFHPNMIVATYWKDEVNEEFGSDTKKVKVNGRNWVKIR